MWTKIDIIHDLSRSTAAKCYLEICTPTTGNRYAELDHSSFSVCHRLMSLCPDGYDDGLKIDYRCTGKSLFSCVDEISKTGFRYDLILVDPWHEYETSMQALNAALNLIADGGTIIVHDCLPKEAQEVTPQYRPGAWCGLTFKAYLDFLISHPDLFYCTVDTDYGCGLIRKPRRRDRMLSYIRSIFDWYEHRFSSRVDDFHKWCALSHNDTVAYQLLEAHKTTLLNLCTVEDFRTGVAQWLPAPRGCSGLNAHRF